MRGDGDAEEWGWYSEDEHGRRSYYSDYLESSPAASVAEVAQTVEAPARFDQQTALDLEPDEREMLILGLRDWGGPASGSDALAVAMGFADMRDLRAEARTLMDAIGRREPLSVRGWTRALVATEFAFASSVLGTGPDEWFAINGGPGEHWIGVFGAPPGEAAS